MNSDVLTKVADDCKQLILKPEENLRKLEDVFGYMKQNPLLAGIVHLSLLKVFKNIIPLYKIRTLKDQIKQKNDSIGIKKYDRDLVKYYGEYIRSICNSNTVESYRCVCELLNCADHFNFADKLVEKVLQGSCDARVAGLCSGTLRNKLCEDNLGETVYVIIDRMIDYDFNPVILKYLLEIGYLKEYMESHASVDEDCKTLDEENWKKHEKRILFRKSRSFKKNLRKLEKERRKREEMARTEEKSMEETEKFSGKMKILDALQRLYFTVLKSRMKVNYRYCFMGISKYKNFIRKSFFEGLNVMLNAAIAEADPLAQIEGVLCITNLYGNQGSDFKSLVNIIYHSLSFFNYTLNTEDYNNIALALRALFIDIRQPIHRAQIMLHRIIQLMSIRHLPVLNAIFRELSSSYDIEFSDFETPSYKVADASDMDSISFYPYYDWWLLKRMA